MLGGVFQNSLLLVNKKYLLCKSCGFEECLLFGFILSLISLQNKWLKILLVALCGEKLKDPQILLY